MSYVLFPKKRKRKVCYLSFYFILKFWSREIRLVFVEKMDPSRERINWRGRINKNSIAIPTPQVRKHPVLAQKQEHVWCSSNERVGLANMERKSACGLKVVTTKGILEGSGIDENAKRKVRNHMKTLQNISGAKRIYWESPKQIYNLWVGSASVSCCCLKFRKIWWPDPILCQDSAPSDPFLYFWLWLIYFLNLRRLLLIQISN